MQQSIVKSYIFVVQTLLNMFRALLCPSSGARETAVAAYGFRMNVEVEMFSAVVGLLVCNALYLKKEKQVTCKTLGSLLISETINVE